MPDETVVSNASTLMNLAIVGKLKLLKNFYGKVKVPQAVWEEVVVEGEDKKGTSEVKQAEKEGWITCVDVKKGPFLKLLKKELDSGEAETIAWAVQKSADLVLLDESSAREVAELHELDMTGVIGILLKAKFEGKISSLEKYLDKIEKEAGFWIKEDLREKILKEADELDSS